MQESAQVGTFEVDITFFDMSEFEVSLVGPLPKRVVGYILRKHLDIKIHRYVLIDLAGSDAARKDSGSYIFFVDLVNIRQLGIFVEILDHYF